MGPAARGAVFCGRFRDGVAEGGEASGEPGHAGVKEAKSGNAAAVRDNVGRLEWVFLVGGDKELDFSLKSLFRGSMFATTCCPEHRQKFTSLGHAGSGLQPQIRLVLCTRSSNKSYALLAQLQKRDRKVHTSIPVIALVVVRNDLGYDHLTESLVLGYSIQQLAERLDKRKECASALQNGVSNWAV